MSAHMCNVRPVACVRIERQSGNFDSGQAAICQQIRIYCLGFVIVVIIFIFTKSMIEKKIVFFFSLVLLTVLYTYTRSPGVEKQPIRTCVSLL